MSQFVEDGNKDFLVQTTALTEGIIVKVGSAAGTCVPAAAATDKIVGVSMGKYAVGDTASIRLSSAAGTVKLKAGTTVAIGDYLTTDANGKAIPTTTAGNVIVGQALEAAAANDLFEALIYKDRF